MGLGDLHLGTSREAIRRLLGSRYKSFQKTSGSPLVDAYYEFGLHLYFDLQDLLKYIEAFPPSSPILQGIPLLQGESACVVDQLKNAGHQPRWDDPSYYFDDIGIALFAPYQSIEAVGVFRKDEYV